MPCATSAPCSAVRKDSGTPTGPHSPRETHDTKDAHPAQMTPPIQGRQGERDGSTHGHAADLSPNTAGYRADTEARRRSNNSAAAHSAWDACPGRAVSGGATPVTSRTTPRRLAMTSG